MSFLLFQMNTLQRAFFHCFLTGLLISSVVIAGLFNAVQTDDGFEHYAERPWTFVPCSYINRFPMPGNTFINIGYFVVASFWIIFISNEVQRKHLSEEQAYMFYVFAYSAILYTPVQVFRILTQNHKFAILDQWFTLPIFSWVVVWACYIQKGWNSATALSIVTVSSCSYCVTLLKIAGYEDKGFEISLAIHIGLAVFAGRVVYHMYPSKAAMRAFVMAILCCMGFVFLKVNDHRLGRYHPFFRILSGHFWSKIADFMQIHFVCAFFYRITLTMNGKIKIS